MRRTWLWLIGSAFAAAALAGSWFALDREKAPPEPPWLRDVTDEVGLDFVHEVGKVGTYFMPQIMGSGGALFDFDNDGLLDIYLIQNAGPDSGATNRLYRQTADHRFVDVSKGSGLDVAGFGMGVAVGDVNNDGWVDVVVTEFGRTRLFLNRGNGTFLEITADAGLDNPLWGTSVSFVDFDRDGWLDLVVVNYIDYDPAHPCKNAGRPDYCHPRQFQPQITRMYRNISHNDPRAPRFKDVTLESGIGRLAGPGLGVVCADCNGDGWPDIFVANDTQPNRLWINQKDGTFVDEAAMRGVATNAMGHSEAGMGVAVGDVDGDGLFDFFVTHLTEETHTLWRQGPRGQFHDQTAFAQLAAPNWRGTGFGTAMADFDHDGALDIAVVNGRVARPGGTAEPAPDAFWQAYTERNQLFANDGTGRFRDISLANPAFAGVAAVSRGLAVGDYDGDGALDLLVTTVGGRARLYRNVAPNRGHWLIVRAFDPERHRDAYGAEVTVEADGRRWVRQVQAGNSYLSSSDPRAHFGLGKAGAIERITVAWPDGLVEVFPGRPADQAIVLQRGQGGRSR
jgi:enediyne biosynthesis protein E4